MRFLDLSLPLEDDSAWSPRWARTRVKNQSHRFGAFVVRLLMGVKTKHLKTGTGWANDHLALSTHGATHVDAPWHYSPTCGGKKSRTIDEMPLDWFYGPGVMLDISHLDPLAAASLADVQQQLAKINHTLSPGEIVLFRTGNDRLWGQRKYYGSGPGISAEATRWLIGQGIRVMGIDAWGWDSPLYHQARQAKATGRNDIFWAAHYVGADLEYCHMERLANLDQLPATGFTLCAFPLKVKGGSAGPARIVAMLEEA